MATAQLGTLLRHIKGLADGRAGRHRTDRQLLDDFASGRDEGAFASLVERHGATVLRVCRRVLGHEHDAEDAFQATFLVLARNARSIRKRESLSSWLYGVAYRTAMRAKRSAARRRNHEARLRDRKPPAAASPTWDDVQAVLEEEIQRLPESFRSAFVLCVIDGKTVSAAAAELAVKESTLSWRLARARQRLRQRLARRGIELSGVLAALSLVHGTGQAAVPAALSSATVRFGLLVAAGEPAAAGIPSHIAALAAGVTRAMFLTKGKIATAVLLVVCLVAGAGLWVRQAPAVAVAPVGSPKAEPTSPKARPKVERERIEVSGRVLAPDGQPLAGAKLFLCTQAGKSPAPQPATDSDGRFRFTLPATAVYNRDSVLATADGMGLDWARLRGDKPGESLTLRLPAELPIRGKVVDLEGKPVGGAVVRIVELTTSEAGTLDEFLKQWAADKEKSLFGPAFRLLTEKQWWAPETLRQLPTATTGPDGTFRLAGIGRDRGLMLGVRGPGIADQYLRVVTRPDFPMPSLNQGQVAVSGPEPTIVVSPSKPILGTVRDARTKQPVAGVRVLCFTPDRPMHWWWQPVETQTDAQGHYRLEGLAKAAQQLVTCDPGAGAPHMHRFDPLGDTDGFEPITHDVELYRGVVVTGQVTDRSTGRPVRASVVYAPLITNGNFSTTPGYAAPRTKMSLWIDSREMVTGADGRFRLTALPGPGALFVRALAGQYTQPAAAKEDRSPAFYHAGAETFLTLGLGDIHPLPHLHAYRLIYPAAEATALTADFSLDPGSRRRGRLLDPEGKPLSGATVFNLKPPSAWEDPISSAEFTAEALSPVRPRRLLFWHAERRLAGTVVLRGDEPEPVTVRLQPLAALTGRVVRKNGEPLAGYGIEYSAWPEVEWPASPKGRRQEPILTDQEGRFRVADLPAGVPLQLNVIQPKTRFAMVSRQRIILEPDKTKDLGNLRGEPRQD
jgi:RNA polymerase sigma factor (sigma-70 family)